MTGTPNFALHGAQDELTLGGYCDAALFEDNVPMVGRIGYRNGLSIGPFQEMRDSNVVTFSGIADQVIRRSYLGFIPMMTLPLSALSRSPVTSTSKTQLSPLVSPSTRSWSSLTWRFLLDHKLRARAPSVPHFRRHAAGPVREEVTRSLSATPAPFPERCGGRVFSRHHDSVSCHPTAGRLTDDLDSSSCSAHFFTSWSARSSAFISCAGSAAPATAGPGPPSRAAAIRGTAGAGCAAAGAAGTPPGATRAPGA